MSKGGKITKKKRKRKIKKPNYSIFVLVDGYNNMDA